MHGYCVKGGWQVFCVQVCLVKVCRFVGGLAGPPFFLLVCKVAPSRLTHSGTGVLKRDREQAAQVDKVDKVDKEDSGHSGQGVATRRWAGVPDQVVPWGSRRADLNEQPWEMGVTGLWTGARPGGRARSRDSGKWHLHRADFSPPCPLIWDFRTPATKSLPSQRAA